MNYFIGEPKKSDIRTATSKPRTDVTEVLEKMGFVRLEVPKAWTTPEGNTLTRGLGLYLQLNEKIKMLKPGDKLFFQFPTPNSLFLKRILKKLHRKQVESLVLVHDLQYIRYKDDPSFSKFAKLKFKTKESTLLNEYNKIIVHNEAMKKEMISWGISKDKLISLGLFDYLTSSPVAQSDTENSIIIAGNLAENKAGYAYKLPKSPKYRLYGVNYAENNAENAANVTYHGSFKAEDVSTMKGRFGLVWDGTSVDTCAGNFGNYLRYNNPFKFSMYMAAELPVIVWSKSALAAFVEEHKVGLAVDSLNDVPALLAKMTDADYQQIKANVKVISQKVRQGSFTEEAVLKAIKGA